MDTAPSLVSVSVTRAPADAYATLLHVSPLCRQELPAERLLAQVMPSRPRNGCKKAIDEVLDCLVWDVTKNVW